MTEELKKDDKLALILIFLILAILGVWASAIYLSLIIGFIKGFYTYLSQTLIPALNFLGEGDLWVIPILLAMFFVIVIVFLFAINKISKLFESKKIIPINWKVIFSLYFSLCILFLSAGIAKGIVEDKYSFKDKIYANLGDGSGTEVGIINCKSEKYIIPVMNDILTCNIERTITNNSYTIQVILSSNENTMFLMNENNTETTQWITLPKEESYEFYIKTKTQLLNTEIKQPSTTISLNTPLDDEKIKTERKSIIFTILVFAITAAIWGVPTGMNNFNQLFRKKEEKGVKIEDISQVKIKMDEIYEKEDKITKEYQKIRDILHKELEEISKIETHLKEIDEKNKLKIT